MTTGSVESRRPMMLSPGESFGAYTIVGPLGRGGMGEVYRARDSRLGREVALKILPEDSADNPERIRRFEQEARAASALNHPNIVVIYETGEATPPGRSQPMRFIAMELLEGESLESLLSGGSLPLKRVLQYAGQIADGLARAHESGIERTLWKYQIESAYRVLWLEAGHLAQTFCLLAVSRGLGSFVGDTLQDSAIEKLIGLDGVREFPVYLCGAGVPATARATSSVRGSRARGE